MFLNEVLVKLPSDPSSDEPIFHISHIDRVYTLKTENINERSVSAITLYQQATIYCIHGMFYEPFMECCYCHTVREGGKKQPPISLLKVHCKSNWRNFNANYFICFCETIYSFRYTIKCLTSALYPARTAWVQKIKTASEEFLEMEKKKREKAYQCKKNNLGPLNMTTHLLLTQPSKGFGSVMIFGRN